MTMRWLVLFVGCGLGSLGAGTRARNIILFLGDAGGIPTLNAASLYGYDRPQALFLQHLEHIALSDTSARNGWTTDSAAGMTAIVTGRKTDSGMISVEPGKPGEPPRALRTILEYAEDQGLSTGVITNMAVWDATPAACVAHTNSRKNAGEIVHGLLHPVAGDGVDVLIGADRARVAAELEQAGTDLTTAFARAGYRLVDDPAQLSPDDRRVAALYDGDDFAPGPVVQRATEILGRNPRGYFLMVEWDMHTDNLEKGLGRALVMDALVKQAVQSAGPDTLVIFTADHSYDLRLTGGARDRPVREQRLLAEVGEVPLPAPVFSRVKIHSGEEVLVAAQGPGAERVHGFLANTDLFQIMLAAWGWSPAP